MDRKNLTPLSEMNNYKVSDEDPDVRGWNVVVGHGERIGTVRDLLIDPTRMKAEYLTVADGTRNYLVSAAAAELDASERRVRISDRSMMEEDDQFVGRTALADTVPAGDTTSRPDIENQRMLRSEEELRIGTREVEAGEVVVAKHVETERVREEVPVERERVRVERRPVDQMRGTADIGPDEIRIPVVEEELVVEKRPVVKEELIISKERVTDRQTVDEQIRRERVDVTGDTELLNDNPNSRDRRR